MEQLHLAFKKLFSFYVIFSVCFVMVFGVLVQATNAQTTQQPQTQTQTQTQAQPQTQGASYVNGPQQKQGLTFSQQGAANGVAACAASVVGGVVSQLTLGLFKTTNTQFFRNVQTFSNQDVARAGGDTGWPPSLDSIGYCIINAVLEYITQATIDWINSGFDGNPAFVEDPEKFFGDIAQTESANFLQQVVKGSTGIDVCQPFRLQIVTGLSGGARGSQYARQSRCGFDDMKAALGNSGVDFDYQAYTSGTAEYSGSLNVWREVTQNDKNNFLGSYFLAQAELDARLAIKENTATLDLTMGRGFLSVKSCTKDSTLTDSNGNTVPVKGTCRTTTPGGLIEDQVNRALGAGRDRLLLADKFDQIVTALVNQLIKTAFSELLQ